MQRLHPTRPRPWWVHAAFLAVLALLIVVSTTSAKASDAAPPDDTAVAVGFIGVVVVAFLVSVLVDPYAGPLLLAATAVIAAASDVEAFDDNTVAFTVPVVVCASFYYALHVWVSRRVWGLSDGGRARVNDDVRERRALVLEIGRRFLVAWTLLFALEMLDVFVPSFGDHAHTALSAVRDAGGVVVVIDVLALAPIRIGEARRVFGEYRAASAVPVTAPVPASNAAASPVGAWRQPPVAVSVAGLQSARARMRRHPVIGESVAVQRLPSGRHHVDRHARREQVWRSARGL